MKSDLYSKISSYVLYCFAALILVVFALFFGVGEPLILEQASEATGEVTELPYPAYTELSLYLCYAMLSIALLLVLVFEMIAGFNAAKYNPKAAMKKTLYAVVIAVVVLGLFFVSPSMLDFVLYLQYALFGIAGLSMLGSFFISKIRS